jgi:MoxR-like ATPase
VLPTDIAELTGDVLRHRLVLSYEALADGIAPDTIIMAVLRTMPAPEVVTQPHHAPVGAARPIGSGGMHPHAAYLPPRPAAHSAGSDAGAGRAPVSGGGVASESAAADSATAGGAAAGSAAPDEADFPVQLR